MGTQTAPPSDIMELIQPTGQGDYTVGNGDCIESIAQDHGHFWKTVWNDPANAQLKKERKDPNVLLPGDLVTIPPIEQKEVSKGTDAKHKFRLKGVPSILKMVIKDMDEVVKNAKCTIVIDGKVSESQTDSGGKVEIPIPPNAQSGKLIVLDDGNELEFDLKLGSVDPLESLSGIQARLANLGYKVTPSGNWDAQTEDAIDKFCDAQDIDEPPLHKVTRTFLDKLKQAHGF